MRTSLLLLSTLLALGVACRGPDALDEDGDGVSELTDCNDQDATVFPGATELCNGVDDDCDGVIDDDTTDATIYYRDGDGDGAGSLSSTLAACDVPAGYVVAGEDCDDARGDIYPGAPETDCTDPIDYNCDGSTGFADADADGFAACEDCDDTASTVHPGVAETCNDVDDDCDGAVDEDVVGAPRWYADADADGFGAAATSVSACAAPAGYVADATDCNDGSAVARPGQPEVCDGIDNDCNSRTDEAEAMDAGTWYADSDNDGHGDPRIVLVACARPPSFVTTRDDCDDSDAASFPGGTEVCDGADNDCDGVVDDGLMATWYGDGDGDGYGVGAVKIESCQVLSGFAKLKGDCNDARADVNPAATEVCNGGVDDDCDGLADDDDHGVDMTTGTSSWADVDLDGFGDAGASATSCVVPLANVLNDTDCDDADANTNPLATDVWYDGVDQNCDGADDYDQDGDGFQAAAYGGSDCDDVDPLFNPSATDDYGDGVDQSCDGLDGIDADGDGFAANNPNSLCADPDDTNASIVSTTCGPQCSNGSRTDCNLSGTTLIGSSAFVDQDPPLGWTQCAGFVNTAGDDVRHDFLNACQDSTTLRIRAWNSVGTLEEDVYSTNLSPRSSWPNWNYLGGSATRAKFTYWTGSTTFFTTTDGRDACGQASAPSGVTFGTGNGSTAIVAGGNANQYEWRVSCNGAALVDRKIAIYR